MGIYDDLMRARRIMLADPYRPVPVDHPDYDPGRERAERAFATIEQLAAEKLALQVENERLQLKFEASQLALGVAVNEIKKVTAERERARDLCVRSGVFTDLGGPNYALSQEEL